MTKLSKPSRSSTSLTDDSTSTSTSVDVALVELAEASLRRAIGAPHRLDLISLEKLRQVVLILRDDARERHREVVSQREVRFAAGLVLAALEDLEDELVALFAVLPEERLNVLERRRFERLESVPLVHLADDTNDVLPPSDVVGQKVTGTAGGLDVC